MKSVDQSKEILDRLSEEVYDIMHGKAIDQVEIKNIGKRGVFLNPDGFRLYDIGVEGVKINVLVDGLGRKLKNTDVFDRNPYHKP